MSRSSRLALLLVAWLAAACSDQATEHAVSMYPDQQTADFKQFAKQCSACHRAPMPDIHPANLWVSTVYRMQKHRMQRGLAVMTDQQQQQVLAYLQNHAEQDVQR